jgi:uncharacterized protein
VVRQYGPYFHAHTPYTVGYVYLDEGFRMLTRVVAEPSTVRIGQRVQLDWEDREQTSLPVFRAVG